MVWALDQFLELRNASDYMCGGKEIRQQGNDNTPTMVTSSPGKSNVSQYWKLMLRFSLERRSREQAR